MPGMTTTRPSRELETTTGKGNGKNTRKLYYIKQRIEEWKVAITAISNT